MFGLIMFPVVDVTHVQAIVWLLKKFLAPQPRCRALIITS